MTETDTSAEAVERLAHLFQMADFVKENGFHRAQIVDGFPHDETRLDLPLNDPCTGDMLTVASLSIEDSGVAPALWALAIEFTSHADEIRALAAKVEALEADQAELTSIAYMRGQMDERDKERERCAEAALRLRNKDPTGVEIFDAGFHMACNEAAAAIRKGDE